MASCPRRRWSSCLAVCLSLLLSLRAQEPAPAATPRQQAMQRLAGELRELEARIAEQQRAGDPAAVQALQQTMATREREFTALATGFDVRSIESPGEEQYELQQELMRLLRPLVRALAQATEGPRRIQELEEHLRVLDDRLAQGRLVQQALQQTQREVESAPASGTGGDAALRAQVQRSVARWGAFLDELANDRLVSAGRLEALQAARAPVAETVQNAIAEFFQRRGMSLLIAAIACVGVWLLLRFVHRQAMRLSGERRLRVPLRVFDVAFQILVGVVASLVVLVVFYVRGDFELLALALVFLLGLGWAMSRTLPKFVEQVRILLNAGAVREGERLVVDGLPYRVEALRLHSRLVNPELDGGVLRLPIGDLVGRSSRRAGADEPWFPSCAGDWVRLTDGTIGRVELQTPEQVVLAGEHGRRTLRTSAYLGLDPANLSSGFTLMVALGVDYGLQASGTSTVPERLAALLRQQLPAVEGGGHAQRVVVEFAQAAASSLDLEARVTFAGAAAPHYGPLRRAIARILVDGCTQNGWPIPFPQLTVHRAN